MRQKITSPSVLIKTKLIQVHYHFQVSDGVEEFTPATSTERVPFTGDATCKPGMASSLPACSSFKDELSAYMGSLFSSLFDINGRKDFTVALVHAFSALASSISRLLASAFAPSAR
ncbi:hypothetical protein Droror1_Dr00002399 [Drosera rotundifolia]